MRHVLTGSGKTRLLILFTVIAASAVAQVTDFGTITGTASAQDILAYWTADRVGLAQPVPLPVAPLNAANPGAGQNTPAGPVFENAGKPPALAIAPNWQAIAFPLPPDALPNSSAVPAAVGTSGLFYISTRLIPQTADVEYPYRAAGKLFFTNAAGGLSSCTASIIAGRVLLTAGHCVNDGMGTTFTNFMFVPAFRNGMAPFMRWAWAGIGFVPLTWLNGGGRVPNAADYAVLVMQDLAFPPHGPLRIGDIVGTFGFRTNALAPNELVLLGYPCNLDNANLMHQVNSGHSSVPFFGNIARYGDDMEQGSSGGPWTQDFGIAAAGQVAGGTNQVVGVASFTDDAPVAPATCTTNPVKRSLGASIFDFRFRAIVLAACANAPRNCGP